MQAGPDCVNLHIIALVRMCVCVHARARVCVCVYRVCVCVGGVRACMCVSASAVLEIRNYVSYTSRVALPKLQCMLGV